MEEINDIIVVNIIVNVANNNTVADKYYER